MLSGRHVLGVGRYMCQAEVYHWAGMYSVGTEVEVLLDNGEWARATIAAVIGPHPRERARCVPRPPGLNSSGVARLTGRPPLAAPSTGSRSTGRTTASSSRCPTTAFASVCRIAVDRRFWGLKGGGGLAEQKIVVFNFETLLRRRTAGVLFTALTLPLLDF
jgi:hypothetical protein